MVDDTEYKWNPDLSPQENAIALAKNPFALQNAMDIALALGPGAISRAYLRPPAPSTKNVLSAKLGDDDAILRKWAFEMTDDLRNMTKKKNFNTKLDPYDAALSRQIADKILKDGKYGLAGIGAGGAGMAMMGSAEAKENPIGTDISSILSQYSPQELENYKKRGMLDSRGIPTLPPGGKFNSQGMPYSPTMDSMSPTERQNAGKMDVLTKAGKLWGPTENPIVPENVNQPPNSYSNRQLSLGEMTSLAKQAGFDDKTAPLMAAIAMGESHGWTNAHNPKHPDDSYGITQINALAHGPVAKEAYNNPLRAMELAYKISNGGTNFRPWTVYTSGDYRKYLDGNSMIADSSGINPNTNTNAGLTGNLSPSPLILPENDKSTQQKLADKIAGPLADSTSMSALALLPLLGQFKITPVNYDPWKYVPKEGATEMYATKEES